MEDILRDDFLTAYLNEKETTLGVVASGSEAGEVITEYHSGKSSGGERRVK